MLDLLLTLIACAMFVIGTRAFFQKTRPENMAPMPDCSSWLPWLTVSLGLVINYPAHTENVLLSTVFSIIVGVCILAILLIVACCQTARSATEALYSSWLFVAILVTAIVTWVFFGKTVAQYSLLGLALVSFVSIWRETWRSASAGYYTSPWIAWSLSYGALFVLSLPEQERRWDHKMLFPLSFFLLHISVPIIRYLRTILWDAREVVADEITVALNDLEIQTDILAQNELAFGESLKRASGRSSTTADYFDESQKKSAVEYTARIVETLKIRLARLHRKLETL